MLLRSEFYLGTTLEGYHVDSVIFLSSPGSTGWPLRGPFTGSCLRMEKNQTRKH